MALIREFSFILENEITFGSNMKRYLSYWYEVCIFGDIFSYGSLILEFNLIPFFGFFPVDLKWIFPMHFLFIDKKSTSHSLNSNAVQFTANRIHIQHEGIRKSMKLGSYRVRAKLYILLR